MTSLNISSQPNVIDTPQQTMTNQNLNKFNPIYSSTYTNLRNDDNINVEDISEDEQLSIASVKGEGFASDLSENEMRSQQIHRAKLKKPKAMLNNTHHHSNQDLHSSTNIKRPTTPMDFRIAENQSLHQNTGK